MLVSTGQLSRIPTTRQKSSAATTQPWRTSELDNCVGSGTTGVACVNTGRWFIGMEKVPDYFEIACERIETAATPANPVKTDLLE